jgi:hypothetical protein
VKFVMEILENLLTKFKFHYNLTRITNASHENQCTFLIVYRSVLLRMRNFSDKSYGENRSTHIMFSTFFFSENRPFYEIMWKNVVVADRPLMKIWRMRIAFPRQQWLHERALILRLYVHCLSFLNIGKRA